MPAAPRQIAKHRPAPGPGTVSPLPTPDSGGHGHAPEAYASERTGDETIPRAPPGARQDSAPALAEIPTVWRRMAAVCRRDRDLARAENATSQGFRIKIPFIVSDGESP